MAKARTGTYRKLAAVGSLACCLAIALALFTAAPADPARQPGSDATVSASPAAAAPEEPTPDAQASAAEPGQPAASPHADEPAADNDASPSDDARYVEGEVLVQVDDSIDASEASAYLQTLDFVEAKQVSTEDIERGFLQLALAPGTTVEEALAQLEGNPLGACQPNFIYRTQDDAPGLRAGQAIESQAASSDAYLSQLWALDAMHVPEAWEELLADGSITDAPLDANAVGVAVIDEGFNVNHEDLKNVIAGVYNAGTSDSALRSDVSEPPKSLGHGTHVAGIVGAQANNGIGIAGVSHNARLYLVKVADEKGNIDTAGMRSAYDYILQSASQANIRVINISIGGNIEPNETDRILFSSIDKAYARGIVTVCSSGNYSTPTYNYPSDYPTAVGVINVNSSKKRANSSNYNDSTANDGAGERTKDISAPGTTIYSTNYSTSKTDADNNAYYDSKTGTSMASPQVAGVMALIFAANPSLTADQAVQILYNTATDLNVEENLSDEDSFDFQTGYGLPNASAAVKRAKASAYLDGGDSLLKGASITYQLPAQLALLSIFYHASWTWESSDESVATVTADGTVTGTSPGTATISASYGSLRLSKTVAVFDPVVKGMPTLAQGARTTFSIESDLLGSWEWSSSDESVATVGSGTGIVRGIAPGTATITATLTTSTNVKASFDVEITAPLASPASSPAPIAEPSWAGASKVPVNASAAYTVENGSIAIVSGSACATLAGTTLAGKKAGKVKLALIDAAGVARATKAVTIYKLSGKWRLQSAAKKSLVLGVKGNSKRNNARFVLQAKAKKSSAQQFKFVKQKSRSYALKSVASGKLLRSVDAGIRQKGTNPTKTARWKLSVNASNQVTLSNVSSGKALDIKNGSATKGAYAIQRKLSSLRPTQQWVLVR